MIKRKSIVTISVIVPVIAGIYFGRIWLADTWEQYNQPDLPTPIAYNEQPTDQQKADTVINPPTVPVEGGKAISENYILESSPQPTSTKAPAADPLAGQVTIPAELNLDVPWMSQAPKSNWDYPYQEACEEASMIMVNRFYRGQTGLIDPDDAERAILEIVEYEKQTLGFYEDTDAEQTAKIIRDYLGYQDVRILPLATAKDIQDILARGYPVIIPFSGKDLQNPNFRNGGPLYHMLVIKGYTADGWFITGDPGTRKGKDYLYSFERIIQAAHDWNGGNVLEGKKYMIVVLPNAK